MSDYDFRGFSQSGKDPALQGSADYAFGDSGLAIGAWASNVDFGNDEDIELDLYVNYTGKINDTFAWTAGGTWYEYPSGNDSDGYPEIYIGFNAGNFSAKQWFSNNFGGSDENAQYTEVNYTQPIGDNFSLAFHAGYAWGDFWDIVGELAEESSGEIVDYAVQANYTFSNFTAFAKFTGTDASGNLKVEGDIGNNEPRVLVGIMTTFPWGD